MGEDASNKTTAKPSAWRSGLRYLVLGGVGLALAYGLLVNLFLNSDLAELVNRRPERFRITWDSGYSWRPGHVTLHGVVLDGRNRTGEWRLEVDTVQGRIDLRSLLQRQLQVPWIQGEGGDFSWITFEKKGRARLDITATARKVSKRPWTLDLMDIRLDGIESLNLDGTLLEGSGTAKGRLRRDANRSLWVEDAQLSMVDPRDEDGLRNLEVQLAIHGLLPRQHRGQELLDRLSGRILLDSQGNDLAFWSLLLGNIPGVEIAGRAQTLTASIGLDHGKFSADSRLEASSKGVVVRFFGHRAQGSGTLVGAVNAEDQTFELVCALDHYSLDHLGPGDGSTVQAMDPSSQGPEVVGEEFVLRASLPLETLEAVEQQALGPSKASRDSEPKGEKLRDLAEDLVRELSLTIDLVGAKILDLTTYNIYLPTEQGLEIQSGQGRLDASLRLHPSGGSGEVRVQGERVGLHFDRLDIRGDLEVVAEIASIDWEAGSVDLDGSRLHLKDVRYASMDPAVRDPTWQIGWWGDLRFPRAEVRRDATLQATFDARLRDTGPLVAVFSGRRKAHRRFSGLVARLLTIQRVESTGELNLGPETLSLDHVWITGNDLLVLAQLQLEARRRGLFYARYAPVALAVEMDENFYTVQPIRPRRWFVDKAGWGDER